jgi:putative endonuclease
VVRSGYARSGVARQELPYSINNLMYYVYVLQSKKDGNIYIGYSTDLKRRFEEHNSGKVKSTKPRVPFELAYYEAYKNKKDATEREYFLKTHQQRDLLKERLMYSLEK